MKFPLLALLQSGRTHGYELKQTFEEMFGDVWPPLNIGQVYTTLQRLEKEGLAASGTVSQAGRPDKKVYEVTDEGRTALAGWLAEPAAGTRLRDEFFLKFVLAEATGAGDPFELIERQRAQCLQTLRDLGTVTRQDGVAGPTKLLAAGAALHLQADLQWLDRYEDYLAGKEAE